MTNAIPSQKNNRPPAPLKFGGFRQPPAKCALPALEEGVLRFWKENNSFANTLARSQGRPPF